MACRLTPVGDQIRSNSIKSSYAILWICCGYKYTSRMTPGNGRGGLRAIQILAEILKKAGSQCGQNRRFL